MFLPETASPDFLILGIASNQRGSRIAVLFRHAKDLSSFVVIHDLPSLAVLDRIRIPNPISGLRFGGPDDRLFMLLSEPENSSLAGLSPAKDLVKMAFVPGQPVSQAVWTPSGWVLATEQRTDHLRFADADGAHEDVSLPNDTYKPRLSDSANGDVLLQKTLSDGREVVALYRRGTRSFSEVTSGSHDRDPLFHPSGTSFAFIELVGGRIMLCHLNTAIPCRVLAEHTNASWLLGFSPSGARLLYNASWGSTDHLRVLSIGDGTTIDLGPNASVCRARWSSESRLWVYKPGNGGGTWEQMDVDLGRSTGLSEPAPLRGASRCPELVLSDGAPKASVATEVESALWMAPTTRDAR